MVLVFAGSGDSQESLSLMQCRQVADELTQVATRAVLLHQQVNLLCDCRSVSINLRMMQKKQKQTKWWWKLEKYG